MCLETRNTPGFRGNSGAKAGIIDLLSNNSDLALTPDGLRKLAIPQGLRDTPCEPAEFQLHRLSSRLSAQQIKDIVRRYEAGESARTLASEFGVAPSALLRLLRERNVVVRQQVVTPEQDETMARDYEAGMTMAELEEKHGLSHGAMLRALHRRGVAMRPKAPRQRN
ncbi:helix-turn-helix domain-containing protein [Cryobacterium lyxosi]|uniref:helix-turn-helix domain-containing protein n=1 Tax=Cryobacterium lyxosi TaxID=1259228 RepID=UPI003B970E60